MFGKKHGDFEFFCKFDEFDGLLYDLFGDFYFGQQLVLVVDYDECRIFSVDHRWLLSFCVLRMVLVYGTSVRGIYQFCFEAGGSEVVLWRGLGRGFRVVRVRFERGLLAALRGSLA